MPSLVLLSDGQETRYELGARPVVVGRSVECDVQVSEERASRRHFQVEPTDRGWVVRDLGSSNGTAVNGYAVSRALLTPGDLVEVGGIAFRFDADGLQSSGPRAPRPERPRPSSAPAWTGALVAFLALAVATDVAAVEAARARAGEVREERARTAHTRFLVASREPDPAEAERILDSYLKENPGGADATQARARLSSLRASTEARTAASAEFGSLSAEAVTLPPSEYRWRLESLVRRWADSPDAGAEIRARAREQRGPAPPAEDARLLFQRRKREADAAAKAGDYGRALSLWNAHAAESPPVDALAESDLRAEVRRLEEAASGRAEEVMARVATLRDQSRADEALRTLRAAVPLLEGTGGGRRLSALLEAGIGTAGGRPSGGTAGGRPDEAGFARKRSFYLRAREAEQFVALRDYSGAAGLYGSIAAEAREFPDVAAEMQARGDSLRAVGRLLEELRAVPNGWKGKPWPSSWEEVPAEELFGSIQRLAKKPGDRLSLAAFAYDQGLRRQALESVCAALENEATRAEAERLYAAREGVPVPEGGFVAEKGQVISRAEWKRRRNAEAITGLQKREVGLLRHLHESVLVRSLDRMREKRGDLDKARAHALELVFDEVKYFYPYEGRMGEYTPVQQDVNKRVEAVEKLWEDRTRLRTKPDAGTLQVLKDFDAAVKELHDLGAEPVAVEKEVEDIRRYFDRDLDVRSFFLDAEEFALLERDQAVMKDNAKRKTVADETEAKQVEITNAYRMMFGRRALAIADRLVLSARAHCDDMSRGGFFSHFNERLLNMKPGEKIPKQACGCSSDALIPGCTHGPDARIRAQGYEFIACSENIHMGSGDPQGAHTGWIHSSGHHRNLLHTAWKEMGTGRVGKHWAQNFGLPPGGEEPVADGSGSDPWDRAGGRGTGEDGNPPEGK
jgi:hypothetical protein